MNKHKALQFFSDEYLEQCKLLTTAQIVTFLEEFRELMGSVNRIETADTIQTSDTIDN